MALKTAPVRPLNSLVFDARTLLRRDEIWWCGAVSGVLCLHTAKVVDAFTFLHFKK